MTRHDAENEIHLKSIALIPEMIEKSIFITEEKNEKGNTGYESYRYYVVGLNIGGEDYTAKLVVGRVGNESYYDHALTQTEKGKLLADIDGIKRSFDSKENSFDRDIVKDKRLLSILENNSSKVVDEEGKPKVVLHGTPNKEFYEFSDEKTGSSNDPGWLGRGFYFYGNNPEYARQYGKGGRVMEVYLNIRNPYYATYEDMERLAEANSAEASREFRESLEEEGYDGVYYNGDLNEEWVAFHPTQIKSAAENNGDFDPRNDDIRFREDDENGEPQRKNPTPNETADIWNASDMGCRRE